MRLIKLKTENTVIINTIIITLNAYLNFTFLYLEKQ